MKTNTYTDAARTQNTIYLRLNYDEPSGTVVNVRKSMWIHPTQDRAISVREAARLQTFPDMDSLRRVSDALGIPTGEPLAPVLERFRKATQREPVYQCIFHEDDGSLTESYGLMFE